MTTDPCTGRTGTNAAHCWHRLPYTYTSIPSQYDEKCCHCAKVERRVEVAAFTYVEPKHGPHAPDRTFTLYHWPAA